MSKLDIMKFLARFDGEISEADFTVDELQYISSLGEGGLDGVNSLESFKQKYKAYYDDVKYNSDKKQDW